MGKNISLIINRIDSMLKLTPESYGTYRQLKVHKEFLIESANYLEDTNHSIAFIGKVGVGKTTAISKLLNLIDEEGNELLQTGGGRTTVCEVAIEESEEISIKIEPYANEEIKKYLEEFSFYIENEASIRIKKSNEEPFTLSSEIERALRNMLDLKKKRLKENGKRIVIDSAIELYNQATSREHFYEILISRINLTNRTETELISSDSTQTQEWIKTNFKEINNGNNQKVSLPKKITLFFNEKSLKVPNVFISILDTKGVDETANRKDIENQLKNPRTISILCTSFNDAPDKVSTDILRYMKDSGLSKYIEKRVTILVLDKKGEAESIADLDEPDLEEGRDIRKEQIEGDLSNSLNINNIDILFFNSKEDDRVSLNNILSKKIIRLREEHEKQVQSIIESLDEIEEQTKNQLSIEALHRIKTSILVWLEKAKHIKGNIKKNFSSISESIIDKGTHVSSVRASVNRSGEWHNLDYYKILSDSSRYQAVQIFDKNRDELIYIIDNMLGQKDLNSQKGILEAILNLLENRIEKIYEEAYHKGKNNYFDKLYYDSAFWKLLKSEWGKGKGYKNRIADGTDNWFIKEDYNTFDKNLTDELNLMWQELLNEIEGLIKDDK